MTERKRVALLTGQCDEFYQQRFIDGFLKQAFATGLDVCIFSMYLKYQDTEARERGEKRIYRLMTQSLFDAVVVLPDTIQTPGVAAEIEERLHKEFEGPVLYVDLESRYFPSIMTDSYTPVKQLIEHLINVHGYKDIAYLTGKKWHTHSKDRLRAYRDVMEAAGLTVREDRVFYGDYWYTSGKSCADQLLNNREDLPEAVACANDFMAIGLCEELAKAGLSIPGDIAVIGFDSSAEGQCSPSPLTSAYIPARATGARAARSIISMLEGGVKDESPDEAELFTGTSCGCPESPCLAEGMRRAGWTTELSSEGFFSLHNHFTEDMIAQDSLDAFWDTVYTHVYQLKGYDSFHICLPPDWAEPDLLSDGPAAGDLYPGEMMCSLAAHSGDSGKDRVGMREIFPTSQLLPEIHEEKDGPRAWFFTPLYFGARNYGYAAISYGDKTISYDEVYRLWIQAFCCGLESIRRSLLLQAVFGKGVHAITEAKFPAAITGEAARRGGLTEEEKENIECVSHILDNNLFTYHFQPIVSAVDGSIYAFEALMRASTEKKISPLDIIRYADMLYRLGDVERATFMNVLDRISAEEKAFGERHVFINSIPGTRLPAEDERHIAELLKNRNGQAVVELTEQAELDDDELSDLKERFSALGVGTAVDDYGTGYSNISNLLRYMPDYVKVDRSLLTGIQDSSQKQHFVREIVAFSHDNDIKVLAEGVETPDELRTVIYLGCDLIQGFYTGRPSAEIREQIDADVREEICRYYNELQQGFFRRSYKTGRSSRISTGMLVREGYQNIQITGEEVTYRDFVLSGTPGQRTALSIEVQEGYDGQITLENVSLTGSRQRPCIDIAPGAKLSLVLVGENHLGGGGIRVPEGAQLTVYGDGDISVYTGGAQCAAIGAGEGKAGRMEFYQDGSVILDTGGARGIGIGGEKSADIVIHRGRYVIQQKCDCAVGIGCIEGDIDITIRECEMNMGFSGTAGCGIGSLEGSADISIKRSYFQDFVYAEEYVGIGSCRGSSSKVELKNIGTDIGISGLRATGAGALAGVSDILMDNISYRYTGSGAKNYAFSGAGGGHVKIEETNMTLRLSNDEGKITQLQESDAECGVCRVDLVINGKVPEQQGLF